MVLTAGRTYLPEMVPMYAATVRNQLRLFGQCYLSLMCINRFEKFHLCCVQVPQRFQRVGPKLLHRGRHGRKEEFGLVRNVATRTVTL